MTRLIGLLLGFLCSGSMATVCAAAEKADLAKQLANPIASLISVPVQVNYDENIGPGDEGSAVTINVQPVIPIPLNNDWNLISRTILPIVDQNDIPLRGTGQSGLGDTVQSLFFSPVEPAGGGWIWGAGPVLLLPTATDDALGAEQWGLGPTAVALRQSGSWTYGALVNHIESVGGEDDRADVSATFVQPFLNYITAGQTTYALNLESTYDWEGEDWSVPVNVTISQLLTIGGQAVQVGGGIRYWLSTPDNRPEGWGLRFNLTLLFPRS